MSSSSNTRQVGIEYEDGWTICHVPLLHVSMYMRSDRQWDLEIGGYISYVHECRWHKRKSKPGLMSSAPSRANTGGGYIVFRRQVMRRMANDTW